VLPECQLRGKFLTSHRTNKQCTPLPLIKGSVSADRESGEGRGEERRDGGRQGGRDVRKGGPGKGRRGDRRFGALKEMLLALLLCPRALDPENHSKPGLWPWLRPT